MTEMRCLIFLVAVASFPTQFVAAHVVEMQQRQDEVMQQVLERLIDVPRGNEKNAGLGSFSWKTCEDNPGKYVQFNSLSVSPDPLKFPADLTISADVNVTTGIKTPLKVSLDISKEEFGIYIHIPCLDGVGSCTYEDICSKLATLECPQQLIDIGINCRCPINPKHYVVKGATFNVPKEEVPSGKYHVIATVLQGSVTAACIDVHFEIGG